MAHAGEVGHDFEIIFILQNSSVAHSRFAGASSCSIGNRYEIWTVWPDCLCSFKHSSTARVVLGREKFDREQRTLLV